MKPSAVAELLELSPEALHGVGDPLVVEGTTLSRDDAFCSFGSNPTVPLETDLEVHVAWMLERLEQHAGVIESWQVNGWAVRLTMLIVTDRNNASVLLSRSLRRRIANLGVPVMWLTMFSQEST
jgi:hypothetical protein